MKRTNRSIKFKISLVLLAALLTGLSVGFYFGRTNPRDEKYTATDNSVKINNRGLTNTGRINYDAKCFAITPSCGQCTGIEVDGYCYQDKNVQKDVNDCRIAGRHVLCPSDFTWISEEEATKLAKVNNLKYRVVESDKVDNIAILDNYISYRINFSIKDGIVTKAEFY